MASELTNNLTKIEFETENIVALTNSILHHKEFKEVIPYKELTYIRTTGTQYLNLGVPLWSNPTWKVETKVNMSKIYDYQHLLSVNDEDTYHETWVNASGYYCVRLKSGTKKEVATLSANTIYTLTNDFADGVCKTYVNGTLKNTTTFGAFTCTDNLRFGRRDTGWFIGYIYNIKLYQDGELIRDFKPAKNILTGVIRNV